MTDNGSVFTSEKFSTFTKQNGIHHVKSANYHPASNGLVEWAVQTFKEFMKKMKDDSIDANVSGFLFQNWITPHSTTGVPSAEMLISCHSHSHLDLIVPDMWKRNSSHRNITMIREQEADPYKPVGDSVSACIQFCYRLPGIQLLNPRPEVPHSSQVARWTNCYTTSWSHHLLSNITNLQW